MRSGQNPAHDLAFHIRQTVVTTPLPVSFGKFDVADAIQYEEPLKLTAAQLAKYVVPFLKLAN